MLPSTLHRVARFARACSVAGLVTAGLSPAMAQQHVFHLDRLEMPGGPDDGLVLFRPSTQPKTLFYAQLGLGYSLNPLRTANITSNYNVRTRSDYAVLNQQLTTYGHVGIQLVDRIAATFSMPVTLFQNGQNPNYEIGGGQIQSGTTSLDTGGSPSGDIRLDLRGWLWRSDDQRAVVGAHVSVFFPTGTTTNFGGDSGAGVWPSLDVEYTLPKFPLTLVGNTGVHFRQRHAINDPANANGLGVGTEWRWAVGGFYPLKKGKYRVGGTIFGQTGLQFSDPISGSTAFTYRNTPIEWNGEFRMKFGSNDMFYFGAGAGTRLVGGYGAPDLRVVSTLGIQVPIENSKPIQPATRDDLRKKIMEEGDKDTDHDGIPDHLDACPLEPEDGKEPNPTDGCPQPPDRDGDGILDADDKCPDEPEDKDGIQDDDGCPEIDADGDGIRDEDDACPLVPGKPNDDPKKNGCPTLIVLEKTQVRVLQQVKFATDSATILPASFSMLQEVVDLLKVTPNMKLSIEGHTDSQGGAGYNLGLSKRRAASVRKWLVDHGVEDKRLVSDGFGLTRPIGDNTTTEGRAQNRRVEFRIVGGAPAGGDETKGAPAPKDPSSKTPAPKPTTEKQ